MLISVVATVGDIVTTASASASIPTVVVADFAAVSSSVGIGGLTKHSTGLKPRAKSRVSFLASLNCSESSADDLTH